jgi:hypothetical protein
MMGRDDPAELGKFGFAYQEVLNLDDVHVC